MNNKDKIISQLKDSLHEMVLLSLDDKYADARVEYYREKVATLKDLNSKKTHIINSLVNGHYNLRVSMETIMNGMDDILCLNGGISTVTDKNISGISRQDIMRFIKSQPDVY